MNARHILQFLRDSDTGIDRNYAVPAATTFLVPTRIFTGRVVNAEGGGCDITAI
ncbi:hypothetical protein ACFWXH_04535 [Mesorhizobium sp. NPDC059054]|uniref:hypothetical protein n=1 Tax=Mesorhizobium sp. NPDC059054 TaxID=3346711 RepID=UPI0036D1FD76